MTAGLARVREERLLVENQGDAARVRETEGVHRETVR